MSLLIGFAIWYAVGLVTCSLLVLWSGELTVKDMVCIPAFSIAGPMVLVLLIGTVICAHSNSVLWQRDESHSQKDCRVLWQRDRKLNRECTDASERT